MSETIALVYRASTGCNQYCFADIEALRKFTTRKPYRNEVLGVIVIFSRREVTRAQLPAIEVADFVVRVRSEAEANENTAFSLARTVLAQAEKQDSECAFWFISALSKIEGVRPGNGIHELLDFVREAMPIASRSWDAYVAGTQHPITDLLSVPE